MTEQEIEKIRMGEWASELLEHPYWSAASEVYVANAFNSFLQTRDPAEVLAIHKKMAGFIDHVTEFEKMIGDGLIVKDDISEEG